MSIEIPRHPEFDIELAADEIRADRGDRAATLFLDRVTRTLRLLERLPYLGGAPDPPYPRYPDMRLYGVLQQPHHVVYYEPTPTGVRVIRVLHSSRDADAIFG